MLDNDGLIKVRNLDPKNPIIGYLNIDILQNKNINVREIIPKTPLDALCIDENKLDDNFLNSEFILEIFNPPFCRNQRSKEGGKLV